MENIKNMENTENMDNITRLPRMITLKEAASLAGLSYEFLRKSCINGSLRHIKNGNRYLIPEDALTEFLSGSSNDSFNRPS